MIDITEVERIVHEQVDRVWKQRDTHAKSSPSYRLYDMCAEDLISAWQVIKNILEEADVKND